MFIKESDREDELALSKNIRIRIIGDLDKNNKTFIKKMGLENVVVLQAMFLMSWRGRRAAI